MKKIILLFVILGITTFAKTQGNLQFNQVVNYFLSGNAPSASGNYIIQTITLTIPQNKVIKIESASSRIESPTDWLGGSGSSGSVVLLDNNVITYSVPNSTRYFPQYLPLWLSEGTHTLSLVVDISLGTGQVAYGMVTGIEFNIVP